MFSRPVSRVARSTSTKTLSIKALPSRVATSQASSSCHQRRNSSSKASHPPGASRGSEAATGPSTAPCSDQRENTQPAEAEKEKEKKPATRLSRRKTKDAGAAERASMKARDEAFANLPAVPPTTHLHPGDVHTSAFFSLHRPISVTRPIPPESPDSAFDSIFETRQGHRPKDVIYTISNAVSALDGDPQTREEKDLRWEILQQSASNSDSAQMRQIEQSPPSLEELIRQFKPFNTPPVPVPMDAEFRTEQQEKQSSRQQQQHHQQNGQSSQEKHFTTTLTITEHTLPSGYQEYSASTGPFVERESIPFASRQPFLSRSQARQDSMDENWDRRASQGRVMYAISVKRQRKLKMKKHKYKKLMRRTRNLRRREGRT